MPNNLAIKAFHGLPDFSMLIPSWLRLLEKIDHYEFYHHPSWFYAIQTWLLRDEISFVLIEEDREPLALIAVTLEKHTSFAQSRFDIMTPQHDHIVLADWVLSPCVDFQMLSELIPSVTEALGIENWGKFTLQSFPESSVAVQLHYRLEHPLDSAKPLFLSTLDQCRYSAWFSVQPGDTPVKSKLRRNIRRLKGQAEAIGEVVMETFSDPTELPAAFERFLEIEACGWKGESGTAIATDPDLKGFYGELLKGSYPGITPIINLLWIGEMAVAAQFILQTPSCTSLLKIGYDEEFQQYSPGSILLDDYISECLVNHEVTKVSLVTYPPWAERWHPNKLTVYACTIYNNNTAGAALRSLDNLKSLAKTTYRELRES